MNIYIYINKRTDCKHQKIAYIIYMLIKSLDRIISYFTCETNFFLLHGSCNIILYNIVIIRYILHYII